MSFQFDFAKQKRPLFFFLSILCGFFDYIICDFVAWINNLPLFCDTIFIMALSFFAGPWWGVLAGFFYHLIDFILNRTLELGHLFVICHFLAALTAGYFKIFFIKKTDSSLVLFFKLIILSLVLCLVMSISGGIIGYILSFAEAYKEASSQTDFLTFLLEDKFHSKLLLQIAVRIPVNIADRFICTFAAWGLFLLGKKLVDFYNHKNFSSS